MVAGGGFSFVCVHWHVGNLRLLNCLLIIVLLLPPPWALPHRSRMLRVIQLTVIVLTMVNFITMSVSCNSGLCLSVSLPLVTSQARLESNVLEPQPGVTAGFCRMFQALGGQDRCPAVPYDLPQ